MISDNDKIQSLSQYLSAPMRIMFQRSIKIKPIIMKKLLFLTFLMFVITPLQAEWMMVGTGAKQGETYYFDPETTQKNDHFRKVWVLLSYDQQQPSGYQAVKSLYEFDCKEEKARSYTMLLYSDVKAAENVIGARHDKTSEWFSYSPGSIFNHIAKTVCKQ